MKRNSNRKDILELYEKFIQDSEWYNNYINMGIIKTIQSKNFSNCHFLSI